MKAKNQIAIVLGIVVILATAAIAGSYSVQTVQAQKIFGKVVSDIAKKDPNDGGQSECTSANDCLGLGDGKTEECGGNGCGDKDGDGDSEGKNFGENVKRAASNTFNPGHDDD
jgi:hypothetical protein